MCKRVDNSEYNQPSLFLALQYTEVCYKSKQKIVEIITFKVYYIHKLKT